ncbi:tRNA cyclic N6-threonylcarbamoyladenosine(37) synthase TcdA [Glaciecola sp. MH2013]|uniref:tRNA cyclic N6-threonylcarbamoyladenosine(37) synthase TcdA n=1 Tax=Glaciecola sp. MH2013 TaxID=2785524 RepID=UPI00189EB804|nr:tRNA cyclic N6-threonylcarbamoyladenosine(37) synthase TcdA [Glaciecola sp. MH2013]MBF7072666.1 tRNA cyclic N6-threonylcarbamoyladenosine(37) synthase TcdA [Glaciecola sp. MH2013]
MTTTPIPSQFSGLSRLYTEDGVRKLSQAKVMVAGIGGVGSWAAEGLARSAVGEIVLVDLDDIATTNINRQLHALHSTIEASKVEVMAERINDINPQCHVHAIEDFITTDTIADYITPDIDVVIDAVDSVKAKAAMIAHCKRHKIKIITVGGAGGQVDPLQIKCNDLAKTIQDPLAAKLRSELRRYYHFSKNPKRNFGVECVYSTEHLRYPQPDGSVSFQKSQQQGSGKMDCSTGFGAFVSVTANFGFIAASRAIRHIVKDYL